MGRIKDNCKALVRQVENISAQVLFPSILPAGETETVRSRRRVQIKIWLRDTGFYDNGFCFNDGNLLGRNGNHLSKKGKRIFSIRLASLVRQALNRRTGGRGCIVSKVAMLLPLLPPGVLVMSTSAATDVPWLPLRMRIVGLTTSRVCMAMVNPLTPLPGNLDALWPLWNACTQMHAAWGMKKN